ncbi:MAG: disulfide bond formation protein B [Ilumatobacteraceae bacterium]
MVDAVQVVTAVLALNAAAGSLLIVVARVVDGRLPFARSIGRALIARRVELTLAVASVATAGSLYFSEVAEYIPCRLCWFQRIAMYPIAVIALVGLLRHDRDARWYVLPLATIGAGVSSYHSMIEQGWLSDSESCSLFGPSCADVWFRTFGFMTLALMALAGFVSIIVLNTISFDSANTDQPRQEPT